MPSLPIHWIMARVYCHATEEEDRVVRALDVLCAGGAEVRDMLEGQHGNPIIHFVRRLEDGKEISAAWDRWREMGLVRAVRPDVDARLDDDGVVHFRVDKQRAYEGALALARDEDAIDVQVKLKAYPARADVIRRVARALVAEAD
jgi:RNA binding exosome subunit